MFMNADVHHAVLYAPPSHLFTTFVFFCLRSLAGIPLSAYVYYIMYFHGSLCQCATVCQGLLLRYVLVDMRVLRFFVTVFFSQDCALCQNPSSYASY